MNDQQFDVLSKQISDFRKSIGTPATVQDLQRTKELIMSAITDWAATEDADLTGIQTALAAVVTGISALDAEITAFNNSPGTLSAADQAALTTLKAHSAALVTQAQAISTVAPVAPAS